MTKEGPNRREAARCTFVSAGFLEPPPKPDKPFSRHPAFPPRLSSQTLPSYAVLSTDVPLKAGATHPSWRYPHTSLDYRPSPCTRLSRAPSTMTAPPSPAALTALTSQPCGSCGWDPRWHPDTFSDSRRPLSAPWGRASTRPGHRSFSSMRLRKPSGVLRHPGGGKLAIVCIWLPLQWLCELQQSYAYASIGT